MEAASALDGGASFRRMTAWIIEVMMSRSWITGQRHGRSGWLWRRRLETVGGPRASVGGCTTSTPHPTNLHGEVLCQNRGLHSVGRHR